jgi:hypothetical protein
VENTIRLSLAGSGDSGDRTAVWLVCWMLILDAQVLSLRLWFWAVGCSWTIVSGGLWETGRNKVNGRRESTTPKVSIFYCCVVFVPEQMSHLSIPFNRTPL